MTPSTLRHAPRAARFAAWIALAAAGLAGLGPASLSAQARPTGGPIEIAADSFEYDPSTRTSLLSGNASVSQNGGVLRAARIRVAHLPGADGATGAIDRVTTEGETFYVTPTQRVRGDRAVYDARAETVRFYGNVVVVQGRNVARGAELTLNTRTRASSLKGADGRVRAVIFPEPGAAPRR